MCTQKEKIYKNIEELVRKSFEERLTDTSPILERNWTERDEFESTYLIRSKCFWGIDHFLDYIKGAIYKA